MGRAKWTYLAAACAALVIGLAAAAVGQEDMFDGGYIYQRSCATCHGSSGEGIGLFGPHLRGNAFVTSSSMDAIGEVIQMGRKYRNKHHPEYSGMPRFQFIRGGDLRALIDYVGGPLQEMEGDVSHHE